MTERSRATTYGLDDVVRSLRDNAPGLISDVHASAIGSVFRDVPAAYSDDVMFELELDGESIELDVSIRLNRHGRDWLTNTGHWERARTLLAAVDALHPNVDAKPWLEFDVARGRSNEPSVYVTVDRSVTDDDTLRTIVSRSSDDPTGTTALARRCIEALPRDARTVYVGAMLSRTMPGVRLNVQTLDRATLVALLDAIGWPGSTKTVAAFLGEIAPHAERYGAQLDLDARGLSSRLGVEIARRSPLGTPQPDDVAETLHALVARGLCDRSKRERLAAWPTTAVSNLARVFAVLGAPTATLRSNAFERAYNHVKVVFEAGERIRAKAYLLAYRDGS